MTDTPRDPVADRERFREFRHALPETVLGMVQKHKLMSLISDFAVPIDKHRQMLSYCRQRLSEAYTGRYVVYGHVGDGHYHINLLPSTQAEFEQVEKRYDHTAFAQYNGHAQGYLAREWCALFTKRFFPGAAYLHGKIFVERLILG